MFPSHLEINKWMMLHDLLITEVLIRLDQLPFTYVNRFIKWIVFNGNVTLNVRINTKFQYTFYW